MDTRRKTNSALLRQKGQHGVNGQGKQKFTKVFLKKKRKKRKDVYGTVAVVCEMLGRSTECTREKMLVAK